jgi:hypothetical protein
VLRGVAVCAVDPSCSHLGVCVWGGGVGGGHGAQQIRGPEMERMTAAAAAVPPRTSFWLVSGARVSHEDNTTAAGVRLFVQLFHAHSTWLNEYVRGDGGGGHGQQHSKSARQQHCLQWLRG